MSSHLITANVGAGKTELILNRLLQTLFESDKPFPLVWVLLASKRQEFAFRQRLTELTHEYPIFANVEFFNFYELNVRLLHLAQEPQQRIDEATRLGLLRHIVYHLDLEFFDAIKTTSGFIRILAEFIYELKQNLIEPESFRQKISPHNQRDQELATIYETYQNLLKSNDLTDREGEAWLALAQLEASFQNKSQSLAQHVDLLIVDGYDQFTVVQSKLLATLSHSVAELIITLTQLDQEQTLTGKRFEEAKRRLLADNPALKTEPYQPQKDHRASALQYLVRNFMRSKRLEAAPPLQSALHFLEGADLELEVILILREIKSLILHQGVDPDQILVAIRNWQRYAPYFHIHARRLQVPLRLHFALPLIDNPAVRILFDFLELSQNFSRQKILDLLQSPYINLGLTDVHIAYIDRVTKQHQLLSDDWPAWEAALRNPVPTSLDPDQQDVESDLPEILDLESLIHKLSFLFLNRSPQDLEISQVEAYVQYLDQLIGIESDPLASESLNILFAFQPDLNQQTLNALDQRDRDAINLLKRILTSFLQTHEILRHRLNSDPSISWNQFLQDFRHAVNHHDLAASTLQRAGHVLITTATDARGLPHEYVFIPGLSEELFPQPVPTDLLYLDSERLAFRQGEHPIFLDTATERADDTGLFFELINLPQRALFLSRPTIKDGKAWLPSILWQSSMDCFNGQNPSIKTYSYSTSLDPDQLAATDELYINYADALIKGDQQKINYLCAALPALDPSVSTLLHHMQHAYWVENLRQNSRDSEYNGLLKDPDLKNWIKNQLSPERLWSATQLRELGQCRFKFFASRFLKLEEFVEPEIGMDARQLGSAYHQILEEFYAYVQSQDFLIDADHYAASLPALERIMDQVLEDAPTIFGFRPVISWSNEKELHKKHILELVQADFMGDLFKDTGSRKLMAQELAFGYRANDDFNQPLSLALPSGAHLKVRGFIDRVDRLEDGSYLVLDYKSGVTLPELKDMQLGRDFQMLIYMHALAHLDPDIKLSDIKTYFVSIKNRKTKSINIQDNRPEINEALHKLDNLYRAVLESDFREQPALLQDGKCDKYCPFSKFCRIQNLNHSEQGAPYADL